jgi:predicted 3-demethylubiquinone-9 3-methyltransferase (glyoxalase superfamily)
MRSSNSPVLARSGDHEKAGMKAKVRPSLMFQGNAEAAMNLYVSLFPRAEIVELVRYGSGDSGAEGSVKKATLSIGDQTLLCVDSPVRHDFSFTAAFSLLVECQSGQQIERLASGLSEGGTALMPVGGYGFSRRFA